MRMLICSFEGRYRNNISMTTLCTRKSVQQQNLHNFKLCRFVVLKSSFAIRTRLISGTNLLDNLQLQLRAISIKIRVKGRRIPCVLKIKRCWTDNNPVHDLTVTSCLIITAVCQWHIHKKIVPKLLIQWQSEKTVEGVYSSQLFPN